MTLTQAAKAVDHAQSWLSRIESLESVIHPSDVAALLKVYEVPADVADAIVAMARQARQRGWWQSAQYSEALPEWFQTYVGLEGDASTIRTYQSLTVPGLLQTEDYARSIVLAGARVLKTTAEVDREVALRMERQQILVGDDPPQVLVVLDEAAVRRVVGGRAVMRGQIERLIRAHGQPNIHVQMMPLTGGAHPGVDGSFTILSFPPFPEPYPRADDRVVYIGGVFGALYLETEVEVSRYTAVFEGVRGEALAADQSLELLHRIAKDLTT